MNENINLWLVRNKMGCLQILEGDPIYSCGCWHTKIPNPEGGYIISEGVYLPPKSFPEVTCENSPQPIEIRLIKK